MKTLPGILKQLEERAAKLDAENLRLALRSKPGAPPRLAGIEQIQKKFWEKVDKSNESGCWPWTGNKMTNSPYGVLQLGKGVKLVATRVSYAFAFGVDPGQLLVCHRCDNPPCVNPAHLFLGTHQENCDDKFRKGRNRHPQGEQHPFAKITDDDARKIYVSSGSSFEVARKTGIRAGLIRKIRTRQAWRHATDGLEIGRYIHHSKRRGA